MTVKAVFSDLFHRATGDQPYDCPTRPTNGDELPDLANIPTGLGKTTTLIWPDRGVVDLRLTPSVSKFNSITFRMHPNGSAKIGKHSRRVWQKFVIQPDK